MTDAQAEVAVPADSAYVAVLRMAAAGLAARLDFTLDDIEDLRMAVGEACALLLAGAGPDDLMRAHFALAEGQLRVEVSAEMGPDAPDHDSFGWQVLAALVEDLSSDKAQGRCTIAFTVSSAVDLSVAAPAFGG